MLFASYGARLRAAEEKIAALEAALERRPACAREPGPEEERPPVFKLDDAKMQEGIANLMGYDPFPQKRSDLV